MNEMTADFEEAAVEMLSTLSLNGECVLELILLDEGYLVYQESAEEPGHTLEIEPLLLINAVEAQPLVTYISDHEHVLGEDPVYLVGERIDTEQYQIHWAR